MTESKEAGRWIHTPGWKDFWLSTEEEQARSFVEEGLGKAIRDGNALAVQRFLTDGADPNAVWDAGVSHSVGYPVNQWYGSEYRTGRTLPAGIEYGGRPLHEACVLPDTRIANILIDYGANVNTRNVLGLTALHQVAEFGTLEMAHLLVQKGAELDVRCERTTADNDGSLRNGLRTPLYTAICRKKYDIATFLLESGASPNIPAENGDTLLSIVLAKYEDEDAMRMMGKLIHHGVNIDGEATVLLRALLYQAIIRNDNLTIKVICDSHEDLDPEDHRVSAVLGHNWRPQESGFCSFVRRLRQPEESDLPRGECDGQSTSGLCRKCSKIPGLSQRSQDDHREISIIHGKVGDLDGTSSEGCPLCKIFLDALQRSSIPFDADDDFGFCINGMGFTLNWGVHTEEDHILDWQNPNKVRIWAGKSPLRVRYLSDPATGATETSMFVRRQLFDCLTSHPSCARGPQLGPQLLSRVIDVGETGKDPHLFVTNGKHAAYATLSYCWGKANSFTTVTANLDSNQIAIPFQLLPATLQDAVYFTRQIGIKYIWIDALCIVQDSFEDWASESRKMAEVYSNAVVCLSGTGSEDASKSLFAKRKPLRLPQVVLPLGAPFLNEFPFPESNDANFTIGQSFEEEVMRLRPLNERGWTLQEDVLSPRIVKFASGEVYWSCLTHDTCETLPLRGTSASEMSYGSVKDEFRNLYRVSEKERSFRIVLRDPQASHESFAKLDVYKAWEDIISDYSTRNFTKESDRLIALDGICSRLRTIFEGQPIAGLWTGPFFTRTLLWISHSNDKSREAYSAPSWSWTSSQTPISHVDTSRAGRYSASAELLSTSLRTDKTQSFWAGTITLKVQVACTVLQFNRGASIGLTYDDNKMLGAEKFSTALEKVSFWNFLHSDWTSFGRSTTKVEDRSKMEDKPRIGDIVSALAGADSKLEVRPFCSVEPLHIDQEIPANTKVWCVLIGRTAQQERPKAHWTVGRKRPRDYGVRGGTDPMPLKPAMLYCLCCTPMGEGSGIFQRVGVATITDDEDFWERSRLREITLA